MSPHPIMQQLLFVLPVYFLPTFFISSADLEPVLSILGCSRSTSNIGLTTLEHIFIVNVTPLYFHSPNFSPNPSSTLSPISYLHLSGPSSSYHFPMTFGIFLSCSSIFGLPIRTDAWPLMVFLL